MDKFDDMGGYLPPYVAPEKTGDELYDEMVELGAYRAWQEEIRRRRSDVSGMLTHVLSQELSKSIDSQIISSLVKQSKQLPLRKKR